MRLTALLALTLTVWAQAPRPQIPPPRRGGEEQPPSRLEQVQTPPDPAQPPAGVQAPTPVATQPSTGGGTVFGGLTLQNAQLTEVIDLLARQLKINYILDPRVRGSVILNTYGETKNLDTRSLLDLILRINGAGMVKIGDLYRIVPLSEIAKQPMEPEVNPKEIPLDDQPMLNLLFLKYTTVDELAKVLNEFIGENARMYTYAPANLLFVLDSRRNMRRTMELISLFDSDAFAKQRVQIFEVKHGRPSDIAKELETVLKSVSLSEKSATVKFLPVDRLNILIGVAPNPGVFGTVNEWLQKLDTPQKVTAGAVDNYVYRVRYQQAQCIAPTLMMLYLGPQAGMMGMMGMMGMGGFGMGGFGMNGMGGGGGLGGNMAGGLNNGCQGMGGFGAGGMGMGGFGMGGFGMGGFGMGVPGMGAMIPGFMPQMGVNPMGVAAATGTAGAAAGRDQTGQYLQPGQMMPAYQGPRIVPNPLDNTLIIQGTPQEYQSIMKLLKEIDIPPRQILLEAKIYEVSLTGAFSSGLSAFFQKQGTSPATARDFKASLTGAATALSAGFLIGRSKELLAFLNLQENATRAKVISSPSLIATDSISASINVGNEVPTLTAQTVSSVQQQGNNQFAQQIVSRRTGVTLNVMARVNPSGVVTLMINQDVSAPQPPVTGGIPSPSFSNRSVQTQITMQDGDTIAIGGIINESNSSSSSGLPGLHRLPVVGSLFGSRSYSRDRTELIVFMTPRVIFDNTDLLDASEELKSRLKKLKRTVTDAGLMN